MVSESSGGRKRRTVVWTSTTYFGEGLPWSILHQIASEYLTAIGVRPAQVGYTSWLHGATLLKFVWSPVVDLFGSLRRWMIWMQALMGVLVGAVALVAQGLAQHQGAALDTSLLWLLLVVVGVFSATHDIACDGYYMEALDKQGQAAYTGVRVAAFRVAMLVGSSLLVYLGGAVSWFLGFGSAAALLGGLALFHAWFLPRPEAALDAPVRPPSKERLRQVGRSYLSFLRQPAIGWVVLFLMTYKMADILMFSMSKVLFDRELGIPTDLRGILNGFGTVASISGAVIGGALIAKRSLGRTLFLITFMMAITEPLFVALAAFSEELAIGPARAQNMDHLNWATAWWRVGVAGSVSVIEQFFGGMATAAQMVFIMRRCNPEHRAAHYAFATAVYSLPQTTLGGLSGWLYEMQGPVGYFWIVSALTLPAVLMSLKVPTD